MKPRPLPVPPVLPLLLVFLPVFLTAGCQPPSDAGADAGAAAAGSGAQEVASERRAINSQLPARPYSEAVQAGNTFYFSGKVAVTDETLAMTEGRIEEETRGVMESFRSLLDEVGLGFDDIVQGTVFLADIEDYDGMNRVYGEYFPEDPPARETVAVREIVGSAAVEISFIAVRR